MKFKEGNKIIVKEGLVSNKIYQGLHLWDSMLQQARKESFTVLRVYTSDNFSVFENNYIWSPLWFEYLITPQYLINESRK